MPTSDVFSEDPELTGLEVGIKTDTQVGQSQAPVNRLLTWIKREKSYALPHVEKWRKQAKEARRFYDGKQLSAADEQALKDQLRPANAFNAAQKFIRFVSGVERFSPDALIYSPIDESDVTQQNFGEMVSRQYDWAISKAKGNFKRSIAFEDLIIEGMGFMDYRLDYTIDPRGLIDMCRIPGKEMIWPECADQNLMTARWLGRECEIDRDEAIARWPDQEALIVASMISNEKAQRPESDSLIRYTVPYIETEPLDEQTISMFKKNRVRILEWQWFDDEPGVYFFDPLEREDVWMDRPSFIKYKTQLKKVMATEIDQWVYRSQKKYHKVFILNDRYQLGNVLDFKDPQMTFKCMTCHYDPEDKVWYGFMRVLIDPQKYANKFFNQVTEIIGYQAKGGGFYEADAIEPKEIEDFKENYARPGTWQEVAPGAISNAKIKEKQLPQLPATSLTLMQYCVQAMEDVSGIKPENSFGQADTNIPGVTVKQRQKSGLLLLAAEFDAISIFRLQEGEVIFSLLAEIADDRLIRVGGPVDGKVIRFLKEPYALQYDLNLDDTERDPNIRQMYAESVLQIAPTLIRMNRFLPELLDYFPLPVRVREKIKQAIQQAAEQERQAQAQGIKTPGSRGSPVTPEQRQADIDKTKADTMVALARADRIKNQKERDSLKVILDTILAQQKGNIEQKKIAATMAAHMYQATQQREAAKESAAVMREKNRMQPRGQG
jgi:hypothetical protein